ncbi:hypothetical protein FoTM2_017362 [Fusarium oxysporum f. sp. vasinfectum]|nr:hypothetical protein FoTM2_017362 [Fusarium oxysporum f. sp. vasinfectum]
MATGGASQLLLNTLVFHATEMRFPLINGSPNGVNLDRDQVYFFPSEARDMIKSCFPAFKAAVHDVLAHLQSSESEAQREGVHNLGIEILQLVAVRPISAYVQMIGDGLEIRPSDERRRRDEVLRYLRMKLRLTSEEERALDPIVRQEREMLHPVQGATLNITLRESELDVFDTALIAKHMHWLLLSVPAKSLQGWREGQTAIRCLADIARRETAKFELA